ncbi:MAG: FkbM family methyltransferase [Crocinitomicaceae bacterium]
MKQIKRILFSILSEKRYLRLLHRSFYFMLDLGLLKGNSKFKYHYKVKEIIKEKDVVLDIGANLGYFAKSFSRLASNGKVICIEPLPQYFDVLHYFLGAKSNVEIHNVALGKETGIVTMVLPMQDGMIRTGLPHITNNSKSSSDRTQNVNIINPLSLIKEEQALDYIKCDVEGYEWIIFQELQPAIKKHLPIIQIEIAEENLNSFRTFFDELGYMQYGIAKDQFIKEKDTQTEQGDFLFVHESKEASFLKHIK